MSYGFDQMSVLLAGRRRKWGNTAGFGDQGFVAKSEERKANGHPNPTFSRQPRPTDTGSFDIAVRLTNNRLVSSG
jgi:hypothetical protein